VKTEKGSWKGTVEVVEEKLTQVKAAVSGYMFDDPKLENQLRDKAKSIHESKTRSRWLRTVAFGSGIALGGAAAYLSKSSADKAYDNYMASEFLPEINKNYNSHESWVQKTNISLGLTLGFCALTVVNYFLWDVPAEEDIFRNLCRDKAKSLSLNFLDHDKIELGFCMKF
jgi:hypothetical protein